MSEVYMYVSPYIQIVYYYIDNNHNVFMLASKLRGLFLTRHSANINNDRTIIINNQF